MRAIIFVILLIGLFVLQYHFSMSKNKWLGLIIPALNILFSLSAVYTMSTYLGKFTILNSIFQLFSMNITTAIFLGIYYACRKRIRNNGNDAIDKMNIQDL